MSTRKIVLLSFFLVVFQASLCMAQGAAAQKKSTAPVRKEPVLTLTSKVMGFLPRELEKALFDSLDQADRERSAFLFTADADSLKEDLLIHMVGEEKAFRMLVDKYTFYYAERYMKKMLAGFQPKEQPTDELLTNLVGQVKDTLEKYLTAKYESTDPVKRPFALIRSYPFTTYRSGEE